MKRITLLLALCLLLGTFTGCSATNSMLMQSDSETSTPTETAPAETVIPTEVWVEETEILEDVDTQILLEDETLCSHIVITAVDPNASFFGTDVAINSAGADVLIRWLLRQETIDLITEYQAPLYFADDEIRLSYGGVTAAAADAEPIRLHVSLSIYYSGLLDMLLPLFEEEYGYTVEVTAAEREDIVVSAKLGEVDLMITEPCEDTTMMEEGLYRQVYGFSQTEIPFLYSHYVLCGPSADPADAASCLTMADAFASIASGEYLFISRGDDSDLHQTEQALWPAGLILSEDWYFSAETDTGPAITIAEQMGGYVLADKATYLFFALHKGII